MTRATNARIAGITLLTYIAAGVTSMALYRAAVGGGEVTARLGSIAVHPTSMGVLVLLGLVQSLSAVVLGVTFYALTRGEDGDLALLGFAARLIEGAIGAVGVSALVALRWLASVDGLEVDLLARYLMRGDIALPATFFAVGSTAFAWLLLRGRLIPTWLAWLGVGASALLVIAMPMQLAGWLSGMMASVVWLPMLVFEVPLGFWLITRFDG